MEGVQFLALPFVGKVALDKHCFPSIASSLFLSFFICDVDTVTVATIHTHTHTHTPHNDELRRQATSPGHMLLKN